MKKMLITMIIVIILLSGCSQKIKDEWDLITGHDKKVVDDDYIPPHEEQVKERIEQKISDEIEEEWEDKIIEDSKIDVDKYENYTEIGEFGTATFEVPFIIKGIEYKGDGFIIGNGIFEIKDIPSQIEEIIIRDENNDTVSHTKVINYTTAGQIKDFDPEKKYLFIPVGNFTDNYYIDQSALSQSGTPRLRQQLNASP